MTRDTSIPIDPGTLDPGTLDPGTLDLAAKRVRFHRTPAREAYPVDTPRYEYKTPVPTPQPKPAPDHIWRGYQAEAITASKRRPRRTTKRQRQAVTMIAGGTREPARIPTTRERWTARCREEWRQVEGLAP